MEGELEWEVKEILDHRKRRKKSEYLVGWKGYGSEANLWEPDTNLKNFQELVTEFNKKYPDAADRHRRSRRFK